MIKIMLRRNVPSLASLLLSIGCITMSLPMRAMAVAPPPVSVKHQAISRYAGELINESGRLRYLAERMGKAYAQQALHILPEKALEQITQSQKRYETALDTLGKGAQTPELKAGLNILTEIYRHYIVALAKPANKGNVAAAHQITDALVTAADNLTTAFQLQANIPTAQIVNLSGRQRMLSQRLARLYFGAMLSNTKPDLNKFSQEFKSAMATLEAAPLSSDAIKRELALAKTQWLFLEQALNGGSIAATAARDVATTSERLLDMMDNLTGMYSQALKSVLGLTADIQRA